MKATIPTEQARGADQRADAGRGRRLAARGAIVLSFVVALAVTRRPLFFADVHLHTMEILAVRDTPPGSGWGTVPTPVF